MYVPSPKTLILIYIKKTMLSKVYCSECGKEICDGDIAFIVYVDPEDADKGLIACEECNKRVYSAS